MSRIHPEMTPQEIIRSMVGRDMDSLFPKVDAEVAAALAVATQAAAAEKKYGPGVSDVEIKIGQAA